MWKEESNKLIFEKIFSNQSELAAFFLKVAEFADQLDHHPDIRVTKCSHLYMELYTHTTNSVTELDWKLAKAIEMINS